MPSPNTPPTTRPSQLKITALHAVQVRPCSQSIVKIETDGDIVGYGEAGGPGPMIRGNLEYLQRVLIGQDPLQIERLFDTMCSMQHPNRPHIPTISGVDIALWDIAGKYYNRPICDLVHGRFRSQIPVYVNSGGPENWLDLDSCKAWAQRLAEDPAGLKAVKLTFASLMRGPLPRDLFHVAQRGFALRPKHLKIIGQAYENCRKALDPSIEFVVHCHNEFDVASAIGLARVLEPARPLWLEDALPVQDCQAWTELRRHSPVPILTGEKLELVREFLPFIQSGAVDYIQPDICFAGGLTGAWRIAQIADINYMPVTTHNIGTVVQNAATAHFAAATRNWVVTETALGRRGTALEPIIEQKMQITDGHFAVPEGPGLGITLREDILKQNLADGEPFWS